MEAMETVRTRVCRGCCGCAHVQTHLNVHIRYPRRLCISSAPRKALKPTGSSPKSFHSLFPFLGLFPKKELY